MRALPFVFALLCASCATNEKVASDEVYHPPVYRTGSNIPSQGGSTGASQPTTVSGDDIRRALPPAMTPKPTSN